MAKPSESLDPTEKLTQDLRQHLGLYGNRSFSELSTKDKKQAGLRLESLMNDVSDGADDMMHFTLSVGHVTKLVELKQVQGSIRSFGIVQDWQSSQGNSG